jgi:hypothetical protein
MSLQWLRRVQGSARERRQRLDRRARHVLFSDWRWAWVGRRQASRRNGEAAENGVDLYEPGVLAAGFLIFALSCVDAAFTIILVGSGIATEANPFMDALLKYDVQTFVNLKIVLTGAGVLFLVALADATFLRLVRVRRLMHFLLATYFAVVMLEVVQLHIFG